MGEADPGSVPEQLTPGNGVSACSPQARHPLSTVRVAVRPCPAAAAVLPPVVPAVQLHLPYSYYYSVVECLLGGFYRAADGWTTEGALRKALPGAGAFSAVHPQAHSCSPLLPPPCPLALLCRGLPEQASLSGRPAVHSLPATWLPAGLPSSLTGDGGTRCLQLTPSPMVSVCTVILL